MRVKAQDDPFDWLSETDIANPDDDPLPDFDWSTWQQEDWEKTYIEDYKHYYQQKEANKILHEAYLSANEQGIRMPQRYNGYTYDPEQEELYLETELEYSNRLEDWIENLESEYRPDELTEAGIDMALDILYLELEPILKVLKEKNAAILDQIIPEMGGIPVWDPVEDNMKENQEGKKNFQYWVKMAAESVLQNLFQKNAEGKYELQREKIELLKQVGMIRFLKMCIMDWEIMQSFTLEVPDEILSYAQTLQDVYESGKATFQAGKALYQQVNMLDTELNIPAQWEQLKALSTDIATNRLTIAEMVNKRKKILALTYRELAQRYQQYGEDLNQQLKEKDQLKMNEAERIKALQIANAYFDQSFRLQAKAEALLSESYKNSATANKDHYMVQQAIYERLKNY